MSYVNELKQACAEFQISLDQLQSGVPNEENNIPIEEDILQLKEIAEFINSKINVIKVADISPQEKDYETVNINTDKQELLTKVNETQQAKKALKNTVIENTIHLILNTSTDEKGFEIYKQKIIEQLDILRQNSENIKLIYEKQEDVLNEICNVSQIINQTTDFNEHLKIESSKYHKEHAKNLTDTYKEQLEKIKMRIRKINFMRVLISSLLIYISNWKSLPAFTDLLKTTRYSVTLDSLLKE